MGLIFTVSKTDANKSAAGLMRLQWDGVLIASNIARLAPIFFASSTAFWRHVYRSGHVYVFFVIRVVNVHPFLSHGGVHIPVHVCG